ncbi:PAAR domain-containing protein [Cupriavidus sp. UYPR2.512]|uniref:PAAR domain-containing protein n=1 Tax=Cupriavidus sp. UYPR2.512 TaxID=1080187 RepID=UPI000568743B|nr:PAAR domain-containing protein [Cupriavidus sp. UYPR2.512]UIF86298.1 PAAR domain-containing protein [Cupriavidus necator]
MPDIRYALRNGDKTSTGGTLIATGHSMFHHGVTIGVEGDYATCPACKAGGPVMNDCDPSFNIHGKPLLVSGARVSCKCATRPLVIHSQSDFRIEVNRVGQYASPPNSAGLSSGVAAASHDTQIIEQYYELVDADTGQPESGYRYDLFIEHQLVTRNAGLAGTTATVRGDVEVRIVMWLDKTGEARA